MNITILSIVHDDAESAIVYKGFVILNNIRVIQSLQHCNLYTRKLLEE